MTIRDREFTIRIRRTREGLDDGFRFVADLFEGTRFVLPVTVDQTVMANSFGHVLMLVDAGAPRRPVKRRSKATSVE